MPERAYTMNEIQRMRECVEIMLGYAPRLDYDWASNGHQWSSGSYKDTEKTVHVEEMLRTYMLNGSSPEEMEESVGGGRGGPALPLAPTAPEPAPAS